MIIFVKIITVLTFTFIILQMLSLISPLVVFIPPILFFKVVFLVITSIAGMFYYRSNNLLFYGNLAVLLSIYPAYCIFFFWLDNHLWAGWAFNLWTVMLLVFYGLIIFKKLWTL